MNYETHNDSTIQVNGTCLQGSVETSYQNLVEKFGEPTVGDEYKTDAEWDVLFDDSTVATIYNWKNGKNYCGADGLNVAEISEWNVGGNNYDAVNRVEEVLDDES